MASRDSYHNLKAIQLLNPGAVTTDKVGSSTYRVDTQGFESCTFFLLAGTYTDGSYAFKITESATGANSSFTDVAVGDILGSIANHTSGATQNTVYKIGYLGNKRYCALEIDQTSASTGAVYGIVAILSRAREVPVS
jgi:hypothetical protein